MTTVASIMLLIEFFLSFTGLLKVFNCFLILLGIEFENAPVQVEIFHVEDVLVIVAVWLASSQVLRIDWLVQVD